jgi:hypothetical protein
VEIDVQVDLDILQKQGDAGEIWIGIQSSSRAVGAIAELSLNVIPAANWFGYV